MAKQDANDDDRRAIENDQLFECMVILILFIATVLLAVCVARLISL